MGDKKKVLDLLGDVVETAGKGVKKELKKASKKSGKQDDLFPETIPTTPEAIKAANKLSAAEKRKFKKSQTDMFPDALKDATEAKKLKAVKKRKDAMKKKTEKHHGFPDDPLRMPKYQNLSKKDLAKKRDSAFHLEQKAKEDKLLSKAKKPKKKAEGGPVEKFGAGGWVAKQLKKGAGKAAESTGKAAEAVKKKTKKELAKLKRNKNIKNKTITKPGPVTKSSDFDTGASKHMPLMKKQEDVVKKYKLAGGGKVKKYASGGPVRKSIDGIAQRGLTRAKHK